MLATTDLTGIIVLGVLSFVTAITVAFITGRYALRAARAAEEVRKQTGTSNGHTLGQLVEEHGHRLQRIELTLDEHVKDHENDRLYRGS